MSQKLYEAFDRVGEILDRHSRITVLLFLVLIFLFALAQAAGKPFWYDELYTYLPASLPSWAAVWHFFSSGADTASPLPALLVHATLRFPLAPEISARIPFMLSFLVLCLCLYIFLRRRYPTSYAVAAMVAAAGFPALFYYSTEIRAYALMLAGVGIAMVCWQSLAQNHLKKTSANWCMAGLWLGLATAICAHDFAVFLFVPFSAAQLAVDTKRHRPDVRAWLALILFPVGLLPVIHGELRASHVYRATFWSQPHWSLAWETYTGYFINHNAVVIGEAFLLFAILVLLLRSYGGDLKIANTVSGLTRPETVFAVGLALMPIYVVPVAMRLGVYRPIYVLPTLIGIILCGVAAVAYLTRRQKAFGTALLAALLLPCATKSLISSPWHRLEHPNRIHSELARGYDSQSWVRLVAASSLPVVVSDHLLSLKSQFYWDASMRARLFDVTDMALVHAYPESETVQLTYIHTGKRLSLPVMGWNQYAEGHSDFLLVGDGDRLSWLLPYLLSQPRNHIRITLLGPGMAGPAVYRVQLLDSAPQTRTILQHP